MRAVLLCWVCWSTVAAAQELGHNSTLAVQTKYTVKPRVDTIAGATLEKTQGYALIITGEKGKDGVTCEVRSQTPYVLMEILRTILTAKEVKVRCVNANTGARGGALVDLEDPKSGSFILEAAR